MPQVNDRGKHKHTLYLTLSGLLVFSDILKQSLTEFRNQAFVRPVAHHWVTLPWASLPVGQQGGIVTLQTLFQDIQY